MEETITLDSISQIFPMDFFSISCELQSADGKSRSSPLKKHTLLPDFSEFLDQRQFAKVYGAWSMEGLIFDIDVSKPFEECFFPDVQKGDSIELFIDTRDMKSAGFVTRFCHHFAILPKAVDGVRAGEITAFRTEDRHELCDSEKIEVVDEFRARSYFLKIFIPAECLHGYDPRVFNRVGFTYRINRKDGSPEHFTVSSDYLNIETQPSLWSSMTMRGL